MRLLAVNDSVYAFKGMCKNVYDVFTFNNGQYQSKQIISLEDKSYKAEATINKMPNLIIHGNVLYNFNYRSYLDTPFLQNDLMQHSVQTRVNVMLKQKYPFTIFVNTRQSNSPYFVNATDINVQYNRSMMLNSYKDKLRQEVDEILRMPILSLSPESIYSVETQTTLKHKARKRLGKNADSLLNTKDGLQKKWDELYADYKKQKDSLNGLQNWVKSSSRIQDLIEAKESDLRNEIIARQKANNQKDINDSSKIVTADSTRIKAESKTAVLTKKTEDKKKQIEEINSRVGKAEKKLIAFQKSAKDSLQNLKKQISVINNGQSLQDYLHENKKEDGKLTGIERLLLSVKQIGIGRNWIDYSELTVKNISLNGVNIELNPQRIYVAAAAGKINYRFRDFVLNNNNFSNTQSLGLIRLGYGIKEKNNLILTYYGGQKAVLNQVSSKDSNAIQRITGFSIEGKIDIDKNNYLIAEYAKSENIANTGKMFDLKEHSNEAWMIKLFSEFPKTNTKATGYYRRMGENFQSFTLLPSNAKQDAWMLKLNQGFDKKRIVLETSIRKNDFVSPLAITNYSSNTTFKSVQVTIKYPKYPFVMLGYYPTSQLSTSNNALYESQYNTFNGIANYSYAVKKVSMNSNLAYTRFYNNSSDTGFLYFNATTLTVQQTAYLGAFTLQGIVTNTKQTFLHLLTIEPVISYQYKNILTVSAGLKYSRVNHQQTLWGSTAAMGILIKKIGSIQLQYDKTYLPTYNRNLIPVDLGRATFIREF